MLVNCPICTELLLPSDVLETTKCGHIFHSACLNRWIHSNTSCPQCRQECSATTIHRVYLPEVNFQDNDSLLERLNDINKQKIEFERKLKVHEQKEKAKDIELKRYKKEFHRVLQRNIRKKGTDNIPTRHHKKSTANVSVGAQSAHSSKNHHATSSHTQQKARRNSSRTQRSKVYFQRKRIEHRNNNNGPSESTAVSEPSSSLVVDITTDSVDAISVSSDD